MWLSSAAGQAPHTTRRNSLAMTRTFVTSSSESSRESVPSAQRFVIGYILLSTYRVRVEVDVLEYDVVARCGNLIHLTSAICIGRSHTIGVVTRAAETTLTDFADVVAIGFASRAHNSCRTHDQHGKC